MINLTEELAPLAGPGMHLPAATLAPSLIRAVMINEVVPEHPEDDFYGANDPPFYLTTALPLFQRAGLPAQSIRDVTDAGVYITNAVKTPKKDTNVPAEDIALSLPLLEHELDLFPRLKAVMLMGDVARKAFNLIWKKKTGRNALPAVSTYKLRKTPLYAENIRIFPSYIMTGRNILIEKSKADMAAEDIRTMLEIIRS